jgi:hypothetical protein
LLIASFRLLPPDPPSGNGQLDVPGAVSVTAVTQPTLLFGGAVVLLGAFVARERRTRAPIVDLALAGNAGNAAAVLAGSLRTRRPEMALMVTHWTYAIAMPCMSAYLAGSCRRLQAGRPGTWAGYPKTEPSSSSAGESRVHAGMAYSGS